MHPPAIKKITAPLMATAAIIQSSHSNSSSYLKVNSLVEFTPFTGINPEWSCFYNSFVLFVKSPVAHKKL